MKKQLFCILLAITMGIGMMPVNTIAEENGSSLSENCGTFTDGAQVISDMTEQNGMYAHPRIILSEEKFAVLRSDIGTDSVTGILLEKLRGGSGQTSRSARIPIRNPRRHPASRNLQAHSAAGGGSCDGVQYLRR